jgi:ferritin-like metal-binding protein YciE
MLYSTLQSLLDTQLQELYAAEAHASRESRRYVEGAVSAELKAQLVAHGEETQRHAEALKVLLEKRNLDPHQAKCRVMDVLIKKGHDIIQSRGSDTLLDLGLVLTMRAIAAYEQSSYEEAKTIAEALGEVDVAKLLEKHLREEGQQERSWMVLAEDMVDALVAVSSKAKHPPASGVEGVQG